MVDRGYTDRPVRQLSDAEVLEEALQAADSAGHYAMSDFACGPLHTEAINRRNACFAEIKRRLEVAAQTARALQNIYDGINDEWHPAFRDDLLTDQDRTLLVRARVALEAQREATR
jgi:hypothetical protein